MINQKDRIKKNIKSFLNYNYKFGREKNLNVFFTILELSKRWKGKEFYLQFEKDSLYKKSSNLQRFISERQRLDRFNETEFKNSIKIPKVLRFNHFRKDSEPYEGIWKALTINHLVTMGCHNIADRISLSNPKKIVSVRTKMSFPHYGINEMIKPHLNGKITPVIGNYGTVKSLFDENGNCWINHSINLIKDENEWVRLFPNESDVKPDWVDKNPQLFDKIGNGVLLDVDAIGFPNMGVYHSFEYKLMNTFSFEDFSDDEIEWVKEWLDWEFFGLLIVESDNTPHYHMFEDTNSNSYLKDYLQAIDELHTEEGVGFIVPLILPNIIERIMNKANEFVKQMDFRGAMEAFNGLDRYKDLKSTDFESMKEFKDDIQSGLKKHLEKKKNLLSTLNLKDNNGDIEFELPLSDEQLKEKRKSYTMGFVEQRWDFEKNEPNNSKEKDLSYQALLRRINMMGNR